MNANDDADLRELFAALRDEDAGSAPPLSRVLHGSAVAPDARSFRFLPVAVLAAAAVFTVAVVLIPRSVEPSIEAAIAQAQLISSWTAPTDAWLTLSGIEIPNTVPSLTPSSVTLPEASTPTASGEAR
jgi:predicted component of type VI protein secretion system